MAEPTPIKTDPDSVSENTASQIQEALGIKGEQTQQNPKELENAEGINAIEPETIKTDSFLNALIENNQNKAPAQETNQAEVDVEALQQLIAEGADPTQLLEETAAGEGEPTDGGGIYIPTIDRTAEEVLADAGFDTTATESQDTVVEEVLITEPVVIEPPTTEDNDVEINGVDNLVVDEDGLPGAVTDASPLRTGETDSTESATAIGNFVIDAPDGVGSVTIEGTQIINNGVLVSAAPSFTTGLGNTFSVTAYNAATGEVTYQYTLEDNESHNLMDDPSTPQTETAFEDDSVSETFAVVLTDTDGDTANTSIIVKIVDDIPAATAKTGVSESATVDESSLGTAATIIAADIASLFTASYGADGAGTTTYALSATDGAATGLYLTGADTNVTTNQIKLVAVTNGYEGWTNGDRTSGTQAFTISIDPDTGEVTVTQHATLEHTTDGSTASDHDDSLSLSTAAAIKVVQTVTDGDGDTDSATSEAALAISFKDDGPAAIDPATAFVANVTTALGSVTAIPLDIDSNIDDNVGADQTGSLTFTNISATGTDSGKSTGGATIYLYTDGTTLIGSTLVGSNYTTVEGDSGSKAFTVQLNLDGSLVSTTDTYSFTLHQQIDGGLTTFSVGDVGFNFEGGNEPYAYFNDTNTTDANGEQDLLLTPIDEGTMNTNATVGGVGTGQNVGSGEGVRVDYVRGISGVNSGTSYIDVVDRDHNFTGHNTIQGASAKFTDITGGGNTPTSTILIKAYDDPDTATNTINGMTYQAVGVNYVQDVITDVEITYNGITKTATNTDTFLTISLVTFNLGWNSDTTGGVTVDGVVSDTTISVSTSTGLTTVEYLHAGEQAFKIGNFGASVPTPGDLINLDFDLQLADGDGDTVVIEDGINIQISPEDHNVQIGTSGNDTSLTAVITDPAHTAATLVGLEGDDVLTGSTGNDILIGGLADDTLSGGSGNDTFKWQAGETGTDTITDWTDGTNKIDLSDLLQGEGSNATAATLENFLEFSYANSDTTLTIDVNGSVTGGDQQKIVFEGVDLTSNSTLSDLTIITNLLTNNQLITD